MQENGGIRVHDLNSHLGTVVNGQAIGAHFGSDWAPLRIGENTIIAGGEKSPFVFRIIVER